MTEACALIELSDPEARREVIRLVLKKGYSVKDAAELAGVSPSAVSRYSRGSLAPSTETVCRLLKTIDEETRLEAELIIVRRAWVLLRRALEQLVDQDPAAAAALIESIADDTVELLQKTHKRIVL